MLQTFLWILSHSRSAPEGRSGYFPKYPPNRRTDIPINGKKTSSSAIAERPRCRVDYLSPKVEDWNWETTFMDIIGLYSTTATYLASKEIEIGEKKHKIRAITPFKVIQGHPRCRGRYQSKARMRLPISD